MTTNYPIEELLLPVPWGHIAAKAWGFPSNKPVLAVHGLLDNAGSFDQLIPLLPREYYFVCIDLPGHGLSSHLPAGGGLEYFDYVLAIGKVLDYLKWKTCIYVGHSFGGTMGLLYSTIYPRKLKKIICLDSDVIVAVKSEQLSDRIRYMHDYALNIENQIKERFYTKEEVLYSLMYTRWCSINIITAEALMKRSVIKVGDKYKWNYDPRLNIGLWPLFEYDQYFALSRKFESPTLFILSDASSLSFHSTQLVRISSGLAKGNKKLEYVTVEGNHNVHSNHPERIAPHICHYLSNIKSNL